LESSKNLFLNKFAGAASGGGPGGRSFGKKVLMWDSTR